MISYIDICHLIFLPLTLLNQVQVLSLTLWTRGGPKTDPLITKPQVIEYGKLYRSEEPEGDGRAMGALVLHSIFDLAKSYSFQDPKG